MVVVQRWQLSIGLAKQTKQYVDIALKLLNGAILQEIQPAAWCQVDYIRFTSIMESQYYVFTVTDIAMYINFPLQS